MRVILIVRFNAIYFNRRTFLIDSKYEITFIRFSTNLIDNSFRRNVYYYNFYRHNMNSNAISRVQKDTP